MTFKHTLSPSRYSQLLGRTPLSAGVTTSSVKLVGQRIAVSETCHCINGPRDDGVDGCDLFKGGGGIDKPVSIKTPVMYNKLRYDMKDDAKQRRAVPKAD